MSTKGRKSKATESGHAAVGRKPRTKTAMVSSQPTSAVLTPHFEIAATTSDTDAVSKKAASNALKPHVGEQPAWVQWSDQKLLNTRISDLGIKFEETAMVEYRDQLHQELKDRGLRLRPHCWFSDDWFSPDDVPGIAIPFYMAHRRLMRLERKKMLEVEGGTKSWCMRIMRHEAGHAMDTAYRLHKRKTYKATFGNYSDPYPETYRPQPRSKKFVIHLEPWYAQSHPAEDFAETFAVWLKPGEKWKKEYQGWPALQKLDFVDKIMKQVAGQKPKNGSKAKVDPVHRIHKTLGQHYEERQTLYNVHAPSTFDGDLVKLFATGKRGKGCKTAGAFIQKHRSDMVKAIAKWTGESPHNINQVIREMVERCRALKLYFDGDESEILRDFQLMVTVHTMNYVLAGHKVAL